MSQRKFSKTCILAIAVVLSLASAAEAQTYGGEAAAVKVTVTTPLLPVLTTSVADTGNLPAPGGNIVLTSAAVNVPNILSVNDATVQTSGGPGAAPPTPLSSQSLASVNTLNVGVDAGPLPDLAIGVSAVSSTTMCTCGATRTCTGGSTVTDLSITDPDGNNTVLSGTVTPAPNTTINIFAGSIIIGTVVLNEQIVSPGSLTVNAIHVRLTVVGIVTDVIVASAHSDITCATAPTNDLYSGRATAIRNRERTILGVDVTTLVSDTGFLPTTGGAITATTAGVTMPVLPLTSGTVRSRTFGGAGGAPITGPLSSASDSTVEDLDLSILGVLTVTADAVSSNTRCTCSLSLPTCNGDSVLTNLRIVVPLLLDLTIPIATAPNFTVTLPLGLGEIVINEQFLLPPSPSIHPENITVNALHLRLNVLGLALSDTIVASSHSDIDCAIAPSAADVTLSGRVMDLNGRAISRAIVSVTGADGEVRTGRTNTFGYYSIQDLPGGEFYIVSASARGYTFSARTVSLADSVSGFDLFPDARRAARAAPANLHSARKAAADPAPTYKSEPVMYRSEIRFDSEIYPTRRLKILQ